jgi:DNA helicase MCM8
MRKSQDLTVVTLEYAALQRLCNDFSTNAVRKDFASLYRERPQEFLGCLSVVLENVRAKMDPTALTRRLVVRVVNANEFAVESFEDLKSHLIHKLVTVAGSVLRVSSINVLVLSVEFKCLDCKARCRVVFNNGKYEAPIGCSNPECRAKNLVVDKSTAHTSFFQRIRLQEIDTELRAQNAGKLPKTLECELRDDLVDSCVSGDIVELTGILKPELSTDDARSKGLFSSYVDVNAVTHKNSKYDADMDTGPMSTESLVQEHQRTEQERLLALANRPDIVPLLVKSLCPSIYGQECVKYGLLLALFGGADLHSPPTTPNTGTSTSTGTGTDSRHRSVRPDIHILLVGDPGMGKSQLLKYLVKIAPRGFYICGKSTTNAGLTVAVCRDQVTNEQTLEAGALVLSDLGICCIDEFEKMTGDYSVRISQHRNLSFRHCWRRWSSKRCRWRRAGCCVLFRRGARSSPLPTLTSAITSNVGVIPLQSGQAADREHQAEHGHIVALRPAFRDARQTRCHEGQEADRTYHGTL